jgi:hypothetical protein
MQDFLLFAQQSCQIKVNLQESIMQHLKQEWGWGLCIKVMLDYSTVRKLAKMNGMEKLSSFTKQSKCNEYERSNKPM